MKTSPPDDPSSPSPTSALARREDASLAVVPPEPRDALTSLDTKIAQANDASELREIVRLRGQVIRQDNLSLRTRSEMRRASTFDVGRYVFAAISLPSGIWLALHGDGVLAGFLLGGGAFVFVPEFVRSNVRALSETATTARGQDDTSDAR